MAVKKLAQESEISLLDRAMDIRVIAAIIGGASTGDMILSGGRGAVLGAVFGAIVGFRATKSAQR